MTSTKRRAKRVTVYNEVLSELQCLTTDELVDLIPLQAKELAAQVNRTTYDFMRIDLNPLFNLMVEELDAFGTRTMAIFNVLRERGVVYEDQ